MRTRVGITASLLIAHTRAFYERARFRGLDGVVFVERDFWGGLQALDEGRLEDAMGDFISDRQIARILERRDHLVRLVNDLIAARGADVVLYDRGR